MTKYANMGTIDRVLRLLAGVTLIAMPYFCSHDFWSNPAARWGIPIVGVILVLTAAVRFCPLYKVLGIKTCKST
jgi:DUF2892 family protein